MERWAEHYFRCMDAALLLLALNLCHFIGDYTHASRPYMLAAKRFGKPLGPCAALVALAVQWPTHFAIDILKGRMNVWFPTLQSPVNAFHWWVFGADQFLHQAVIILIAFTVTA